MVGRKKDPKYFGLMAMYADAEDLILAAERTREAGYRHIDAYTPFPVHGLADAVGVTGNVLSVEGSPAASKDARKNLHGFGQIEIVQGKVERVLRSQAQVLDAVVLDPPRAGAGKTVVQAVASRKPRVVGYVACDPASFARDLGYFLQLGWKLDSLRVFDLYPHTHHMESFAVLTPGTN